MSASPRRRGLGGVPTDPHGLCLHAQGVPRVLVLNCGSSSLKYRLFDTTDPARGASGVVERIEEEGTRLVRRDAEGEATQPLPRGGYREALEAVARALGGESGIAAVGHRVVHGGENLPGAVVVTDEVLARIEALGPLAPLHNPVNAAGIREARRLLPGASHVAVFDTAFHRTLPPRAFLYGLPYEYYEGKGVRRYGFHGTSHHYVTLAAAQHLGRRPAQLRMVSCHLGNGASVCAVDRGRSIDTSMGFTPAEGLIMGTRCGDLDSGVIEHLERTEGLSVAQVDELLNRRSGLLGLSGISGDMREVERAATDGAPRARLALEVFAYRVRKYIGAYAAALGGVDAVVLTGGIGQGSARVRALALQGLGFLGMRLDARRNRAARGFERICRISADNSPVAVLVVPTDEERMIARETLRVLGALACED